MKKVAATGVGSARPLVSTRMWSKGSGRAEQLLQDVHEVGAHVDDAADAAVRHLEDLFLRGHHEVGVDVDFTELVLDDGDPRAMPPGEDVVEQAWSCPSPRKPVRIVTGTGGLGGTVASVICCAMASANLTGLLEACSSARRCSTCSGLMG